MEARGEVESALGVQRHLEVSIEAATGRFLPKEGISMDDRNDIKKQLDDKLVQLQIAVIDQLLAKVADGCNLREALDCLRLNKRSITESDALGGNQSMQGYLDNLLDTMDVTKRNRT